MVFISAAIGASAASISAASATAAAISATTILLAVGAALTAFSTFAQIQAQQAQAAALRKQGQFEAAVAEQNVTLAGRAAKTARARGRLEATERRSEIGQLIGVQRAALAGSGVEVDTGSALGITTDTAGIGELEALRIENEAERDALGFLTQGISFQSRAELARLRSRQPSTTVATALTGASKIAGSFAISRANRIA